MFAKSQFYINFLKNFEIFHKLGEILIVVKIFKNFNFDGNFRKISISPSIEKRFEESRFQSKFVNNFDYIVKHSDCRRIFVETFDWNRNFFDKID